MSKRAKVPHGTCPPAVLLFDIGGVLIRWDPANLYRQMFATDVEMQAFFDTCCTREWHVEHDKGRPMDENAAPLLQQFPHWREQILAWKERWADMFAGSEPGMADLLQALTMAGHRLYALSNMPSEVMPINRQNFTFLNLFEEIYVSADLKMMKPQPEIFEYVLGQIKCNADEVLFIDDVEENINAAATMGMRVHLFDGVKGLRETFLKQKVIF